MGSWVAANPLWPSPHGPAGLWDSVPPSVSTAPELAAASCSGLPRPPVMSPTRVTSPHSKFLLLKDLSVWRQVSPPLWEKKECQAQWSQRPLVTASC